MVMIWERGRSPRRYTQSEAGCRADVPRAKPVGCRGAVLTTRLCVRWHAGQRVRRADGDAHGARSRTQPRGERAALREPWLGGWAAVWGEPTRRHRHVATHHLQRVPAHRPRRRADEAWGAHATQTRILKRWGHYSDRATQTVRVLVKHGYSNGEGTTQTGRLKRWEYWSNRATQTVRALLKHGYSNGEGTTQTGRLKRWEYWSNRATQTVRALLKHGYSNGEGTTQTGLLKRWGHYSNRVIQTLRALLKQDDSNAEGTTQSGRLKRWGRYSNTAT